MINLSKRKIIELIALGVVLLIFFFFWLFLMNAGNEQTPQTPPARVKIDISK